MTQTSEDAPQLAGRREWIGLGVLSFACVLYVMDLTVLHLAIPAISTDLRPSSAQLLWIIDVYGFLVAGSLITMGTLGDRIGRRRLLMIGAAAFGIASIAAAFSRSAEMLIVTRALLGVAGATLAPSTLSLLRSMFHDPGQRTRAIGIWVTSFSLGGAIGPVLGGVMLEFFWWGAVFLLAVPVMMVLLILGPHLLPEYRDPNPGKVDVASAALSLGAVLSMIFALKQVAQNGMSFVAVVAIAVGMLLGSVFVRRQRGLEHPFVDLALFKIPTFSRALAIYGAAVLLVFGGFLFLPQYLQLVLGLSALESGLWMLPWSMAFVIGSNLTPVIVRRVRPSTLMSSGLVFASAGFAALSTLDAGSSLAVFVFGSVVFAFGTSPLITLTNDLIMTSAPPERAGAAAGLSETAAELGGAMSIAIFGSIGTAIYRATVGAAIPPSMPHEVAEAARSTLGGAVEVATQTPGAIGSALLEVARDAFVRGLRVSALVSAVGTLILASVIAMANKERIDVHLDVLDEQGDPANP